MPSFDIVSELNLMEVENAFNQARKSSRSASTSRGRPPISSGRPTARSS